MAIILREGPIAVSDRDAKALTMSLDLHCLNNVEIEVLIHLDDVIHLRSSIKKHSAHYVKSRLLKVVITNQLLYNLECGRMGFIFGLAGCSDRLQHSRKW
jgi:hypothetical protein